MKRIYLTTFICCWFLLVSNFILAQKDQYAVKLMEALNAGDSSKAIEIASNVKSVNYKDSEDRSLLMIASKNGYTEIARILIENGAKLDLQDRNGITALIFATSFGNTEVVKLLVIHGANLNLKTRQGKTALMIASQVGNTEIANIIQNSQFNNIPPKLKTEARGNNTGVNKSPPELISKYDPQRDINKIDTISKTKINPLETDKLLLDKGVYTKSTEKVYSQDTTKVHDYSNVKVKYAKSKQVNKDFGAHNDFGGHAGVVMFFTGDKNFNKAMGKAVTYGLDLHWFTIEGKGGTINEKPTLESSPVNYLTEDYWIMNFDIYLKPNSWPIKTYFIVGCGVLDGDIIFDPDAPWYLDTQSFVVYRQSLGLGVDLRLVNWFSIYTEGTLGYNFKSRMDPYKPEDYTNLVAGGNFCFLLGVKINILVK